MASEILLNPATAEVVKFPRSRKRGPKARTGPCAEIIPFPGVRLACAQKALEDKIDVAVARFLLRRRYEDALRKGLPSWTDDEIRRCAESLAFATSIGD